MKLVKEHLDEEFKRESDPIKDMGIGITNEAEIWAHEMVSALENHKVREFGGSLPVEDVKIGFLVEGAADVTGNVKVGNTIFNLYFAIRDNRRWNDPTPKWEAEVSISSPQRKGFFSVKATGKNTAPQMLLKKLSDIFNLKYRR